MTDKRKIDEATGMPVVRGDHFWRVRNWNDDLYGDWKYLELHRYEPRWYSRKRTVEVASMTLEILTDASIREAAFDILADLDYKASQEKFYGDYPPKSLDQ